MKIIDADPPKKRQRWTVQPAHPGYVIEPCPKCGFPEADGGHCSECGYTFRSTVIDRRSRKA